MIFSHFDILNLLNINIFGHFVWKNTFACLLRNTIYDGFDLRLNWFWIDTIYDSFSCEFKIYFKIDVEFKIILKSVAQGFNPEKLRLNNNFFSWIFGAKQNKKCEENIFLISIKYPVEVLP